MERLHGSRWWLVLITGIAGILFGVLTFVWPGTSLFALVTLFGAYALVDGIFTLVDAFTDPAARPRRGWMIFHGVADLAAGILAWTWPGMTAMVLLYIIAAWAIVTGFARIFTGVRLRKQIEGEWMLILSGVLSIVLGMLFFSWPVKGALVVTLWIGAYAFAIGILMVFVSFKLRSLERRIERHFPVGGTPHAV
jgi:uncharacterized membrane protein HdeD (DUF308 family)